MLVFFYAEKKIKLESWHDNLLCKRGKVVIRDNPLRSYIELVRYISSPANHHSTKTDQLQPADHCKIQQVILTVLLKATETEENQEAP